MNEEEFKQWCTDAWLALLARYEEHECTRIIDFFKHFDTSNEYALVGRDKVKQCVSMVSDEHFSLYNSLMCRVWLYAPYILAQNSNETQIA